MQCMDESSTIIAAEAVLAGERKQSALSRLLPFLGPAFVASVAYVDPGNFATNIQAGASLGYKLLWVVVASNLMAMLLQSLSAKLGIATGRNLAQLCREEFSRPVVWGMWVVTEVVAMATDLAEFLGAALGFHLLLGLPLLGGAVLTALITMLLLNLERFGFRPLEVAIALFVGIIASCYLVELLLGKPNLQAIFYHAVVPQFGGREGVLLACGILGATVMPHVIFLHSALTQGRIVTRDPLKLAKLFRFQIVDVIVAMGVAGLINAAMLITAAATFFDAGLSQIATIEEAHRTLVPILGSAASWLFALSLLASGLSSSVVGTMAGQVVMDGFLRRRFSLTLRRLITLVPSLLIIAAGVDPTWALVVSQVVLSFGLPFAVVPLVLFTSQRRLMGSLVNTRITSIAAGVVALLIIGLNLFLLQQTLFG